jgi:hypothetical protein
MNDALTNQMAVGNGIINAKRLSFHGVSMLNEFVD